MKIIVPMAGRGSRLRPHTLTTPKPLVKVVGKPIVHQLVKDLAEMAAQPIDEVAFIIGPDFGEEVENDLKGIAKELGAKGSIYYQVEKLGTAHALLQAKDSMEGNTIVAFADTLFKADFKIDPEKDGVIWVQQVEDPRRFGVVEIGSDGAITSFVEKPETFVSNLAIIGIYYFKDGGYLRDELQYLLDNDIKDKGEYQITNALDNMKNKGTKFFPGEVQQWMDCGNKDVTVETNQRYMDLIKDKEKLVADSAKIVNSVVIEPCYIGANAEIHDSVVGPHASIGANSKVVRSVIDNSIVQEEAHVENARFTNSMVGNKAHFVGRSSDLSIGDYTQIKE